MENAQRELFDHLEAALDAVMAAREVHKALYGYVHPDLDAARSALSRTLAVQEGF